MRRADWLARSFSGMDIAVQSASVRWTGIENFPRGKGWRLVVTPAPMRGGAFKNPPIGFEFRGAIVRPFPDKKYTVIYADPPWSYGDKGFGKREGGFVSRRFAPEAGRYQTMTMAEIMSLPVPDIAASNSVLLLWATSPLLPEALQVISSWGFKFKTVAFCWSKITTAGKEVANLGQWTMGNVELCLLATKGRPTRHARNVRQLVVTERTEHSKKPNQVRGRIETLFGDVPRIELFARDTIPGWDAWGDQLEPIRQSLLAV